MDKKTFVEWRLPDECQYNKVCSFFETDRDVYQKLVDQGKYTPNASEQSVYESIPSWRGVAWNPEKGTLKVYKATDRFGYLFEDEFVVADPGSYAHLLEDSLNLKDWRDDIKSEIELNIICLLRNFARESPDDQYKIGSADSMRLLMDRVNRVRRKIFYDQLGKYAINNMEDDKKTFVFKATETHEIYIALEANDYDDARELVQNMLEDKVYDPTIDGVSYEVDFEKDYEGDIPIEKIGSDYTPTGLYSDEKIKYRIGGVNKHGI